MRRAVLPLILLLHVSVADAAAGPCQAGQRMTAIVACLGDSESGAFNGTDAWCQLWAAHTWTVFSGYPFAQSGTDAATMSTEFTASVAGHAYSAISLGAGTNDCFLASDNATADSKADGVVTAYQNVVNSAYTDGYRYIVVGNVPPAKNASGYSSFVQRCIDRVNEKHGNTGHGLATLTIGSGGTLCRFDLNGSLDVDDDLAIDAGFDSGDGKHPNQSGKQAEGDKVFTTCGALSR